MRAEVNKSPLLRHSGYRAEEDRDPTTESHAALTKHPKTALALKMTYSLAAAYLPTDAVAFADSSRIVGKQETENCADNFRIARHPVAILCKR